jgi:hypothetical protein
MSRFLRPRSGSERLQAATNRARRGLRSARRMATRRILRCLVSALALNVLLLSMGNPPAAEARGCPGVYDVGPTGFDPADAVRVRVARVSCARATRLIRAFHPALGRHGPPRVRIGPWRCSVRPTRCRARGGKRVRWQLGSIHPPCRHPGDDTAQTRLQRVSCRTARALILAHSRRGRVCWSFDTRRVIRCTLVVKGISFRCSAQWFPRFEMTEQLCRASSGREVAWREFYYN